MEKLKQVLAQEDTVLFIGSGISLWAGLPTWSQMIEELAQFVERNGDKADLIRIEANRGDLLQAASYGFDRLTKQQIGEFIRATCRYGVTKPHDIHHKIVSLGPRCFITTNYDDLIEQSLRKWQPDRFYKPAITNRHLTETAEIIHARAIDFIFKPHGDVGDIESIILTREQYRLLMPQGERQGALESVKMLLASRPVVYFRFGLRDPDFIYLRDLLANTYKGGTRDHYAVMADVSDTEVDYWRRNYGIHLINYVTAEKSDKTRDHAELSTLLDRLLQREDEIIPTFAFDPKAPTVVLALARHASALMRTSKLTHELSIRVHSDRKRTNNYWHGQDKFEHLPVESFLDSGPNRAVLVGLPGAGKSYSIRRAAARISENLNNLCLADDFNPSAVIVPIIADLKLYQGDLTQLVSKTIPSGLSLNELIKSFNVKIFLDSFNEMPREFLESGSYESDFQLFIKNTSPASIIIGSRTTDGLEKLGLSTYCLDQIDSKSAIKALQQLGVSIVGRLGKETLQLLQRPFYFQYVASGEITLPKESHPRDFYKCLFTKINNDFLSRFNYQINFESALSIVAYESLNHGEEAFPISELLRVLKRNLDAQNIVDILPQDVANWLVSKSVLIPYLGGRIAFVHQSVTEYLAATKLANEYLTDRNVLKKKLTLTRWDQALFLTLSLLPYEQAELFLHDIIKVDFSLALDAVRYLETGRNDIVSILLSEVHKLANTCIESMLSWKIVSAIEFRLPLSNEHEMELRAIINCGNSLGGAAIIRLVELKGEKVKEEILNLLVEKHDDYNFCCNGIASALEPFASENDASMIASWADDFENKTYSCMDDEIGGFICGSAKLLSSLDLSIIKNEFLPNDEEKNTPIPKVRATILCQIIREHHSTPALELAAELLLKDVEEAATAIYFIANFGGNENQLSWASFSSQHIMYLYEIMKKQDGRWAIEAMVSLCRSREDLAVLVEQMATQQVRLTKAALLYCASPNNLAPVFEALKELTSLSKEELVREPLHLLNGIDIDWVGREEILVSLLRLRNIDVAQHLLGDGISYEDNKFGILEIGAIEWWLEWMLDVQKDIVNNSKFWFFLNQLGSIFSNNLSGDVRKQFILELNKLDSKYRNIIMMYIIPYFKDITTDAFSADAISFLLASLNREGAATSFRGHILGNISTERFIEEKILPLLSRSTSPLTENLHAVIRQAGTRHGRRYFIE